MHSNNTGCYTDTHAFKQHRLLHNTHAFKQHRLLHNTDVFKQQRLLHNTHAFKQHRLSQNSSPVCSSFLLVIAFDTHIEPESEKWVKSLTFTRLKMSNSKRHIFSISRRIINRPGSYFLFPDYTECRLTTAKELTLDLVGRGLWVCDCFHHGRLWDTRGEEMSAVILQPRVV